MDYYGLLFLYYLKGLSGKSVLRLFFNIEAGGTEQLLPENTSTPTTTPILADIQYPDGLRTDQYFTYRETPTTVSNKARIKTIKGNTLVWNQLVQNGNFADGTNSWRKTNQTDSISVSDNILSFHTNYVYDSVSNTLPTDVNNHVVLVKAQVRTQGNSGTVSVKLVNDFAYTNRDFSFSIEQTNVWTDVLMYGTYTTTPQSSTELPKIGFQDYRNISSSNLIEVKNVQVFDLTLMGLDVTADVFMSLFNLPYYSYNQGSLLSFNGNGIKTTGKNLLEIPTYSTTWAGLTITSNKDDGITIKGTATTSGSISEVGNYVKLIKGKTYTISGINGGSALTFYIQATNEDLTQQLFVITNGSYQYTPTQDETIFLRVRVINGAVIDTSIKMQCEFGSSASDYEPYTSSTLSLPISTYFPTGMKSAGTVYDELLPTKAIKRIGAVDLGSVNYNYAVSSGVNYFFSTAVPVPARPVGEMSNLKSSLYTPKIVRNTIGEGLTEDMTMVVSATGLACFRNDNITSASAFKTAMSGVYLYYELATPTETPITTEDANEALSLLMGKSVSSDNAKQMIDIITKGE